MVNQIYGKFLQRYKVKPLLVRSPGRVNLIGEHTDYNEGFVLPAAIDKRIIFAIAPRKDQRCQMHAADLNEDFQFELNHLSKSDPGWPNYLMGVVDQFIKAGYHFHGFDIVFGGDIPIGAGMSSSAAIEAGLAFALNEIFSLGIAKIDLVKMAQKAENQFVGVRCGIMDQFINIFGASNKVVRLDCRTLDYEYYPFEFDDIQIVLCDTRVSHSLAASEYNIRRQQCEAGVEILKQADSQIKSLRDVSLALLQEQRVNMTPVTYKRCDYVVRENDRLNAACQDLLHGDLEAFGKKMYATHAGLRDDYQVSCPELDFLVKLTENDAEVLGARMMGGGFGGCTINLVKQPGVPAFIEKSKKAYKTEFDRQLAVYVTRIESGASIIL